MTSTNCDTITTNNTVVCTESVSVECKQSDVVASSIDPGFCDDAGPSAHDRLHFIIELVNSKLDNVLKAGSLLGSDLGNDDLENVIVSLACETSEVARKNMGEVTACYREALATMQQRLHRRVLVPLTPVLDVAQLYKLLNFATPAMCVIPLPIVTLIHNKMVEYLATGGEGGIVSFCNGLLEVEFRKFPPDVDYVFVVSADNDAFESVMNPFGSTCPELDTLDEEEAEILRTRAYMSQHDTIVPHTFDMLDIRCGFYRARASPTGCSVVKGGESDTLSMLTMVVNAPYRNFVLPPCPLRSVL